ncbi:MAG: hypothetical protein EZS28_024052 [Streblomastix strix]|uniref:Tyr recombinase domain-containing protein n=1 Tax=Streblomastix strix TaxID=222440 RepID=A0A5J4VD41_9EUKA|nr:MAG: hypothetical protein EZS28_024052 [Streblomastix strix]
MILKHHSGQLGCRTRLSVTSMEGRTTIPPSTDSIDLGNSQQSKRRECASSDGDTQLAIPILVAKSDQASIKICKIGEKHRRFEDGRSNEESKKASSSRRITGSQVRGDREEELFKWILSKRQFTEVATQQVIEGWHSFWSRHRQRIGEFEEFWTKSGKFWEDLTTVKDPETVISNFIAQQVSVHATNANSYACRTAVGMLFRIQGFQEDRINGFGLKQIKKKPVAATKKKRREEPIYKLDILLKHIQERAEFKRKLSEQEHLVCTISSIIAFSTLRLAEIYRASVTQLEDNVWQLSTSIWKGDNYDLTVTFRPLSNLKVCPTSWFSIWITLRKEEDRNNALWWRPKNKKVSSYEYLSKAVHIIMEASGVVKGNSVTSICKSSITKSINHGATIQEINRASRHKDGPSTVAVHYDMNLNDTIRERLTNFE